MMILRIEIALLLMVVSVVNAQSFDGKRIAPLEKHGTCAVVVQSRLGSAFVIDSRITETRGDTLVRQYAGCKVLIARPTILLAGVGLEDFHGVAGRWNSLDEASKALGKLPENPSAEQLDHWGIAWGETLMQHFMQEREKPVPGVVSELVLLTNINRQPYFNRVTVLWNGMSFHTAIFGGKQDKPVPTYSTRVLAAVLLFTTTQTPAKECYPTMCPHPRNNTV